MEDFDYDGFIGDENDDGFMDDDDDAGFMDDGDIPVGWHVVED
jgi:hypothetical protein